MLDFTDIIPMKSDKIAYFVISVFVLLFMQLRDDKSAQSR